MLNFREEYYKELKKSPKFCMEAGRVQDELHHRKMMAARRRRMFVSVASAACLFLVCSLGTVTAMNYYSSRITMERGGFTFLSPLAQEKNEAPGEGAAFQMAKETATEAVLEENVQQVAELSSEIISERSYDSLEEFWGAEDIRIAIPKLSQLGSEDKMEEQNILVVDTIDYVSVFIVFEDRHFFMSQTDYRDHPIYSSSSAFMGECVNERQVKNDAGPVWQVFDSKEEGVITSTHAAISINGRDLVLTFWGYKNSEIDAVLKQLDVSIYFIEE